MRIKRVEPHLLLNKIKMVETSEQLEESKRLENESTSLKLPNIAIKMQSTPETVQLPDKVFDPPLSYIANLSRGPILLTAPHSAVLFRGGISVDGKKERTHMRESWAASIVLMLANEIDNLQAKSKQKTGASFIVWNKD